MTDQQDIIDNLEAENARLRAQTGMAVEKYLKECSQNFKLEMEVTELRKLVALLNTFDEVQD